MFDHKRMTLGTIYGLLANAGSAAIFAFLVSQIQPKFLSVLTSPAYLLYVLGSTALIAFMTSMAGTWDYKKTFTLLAAVMVSFVVWVHTFEDGRTLFENDPWLYLYTLVAVGILYLGSRYYKTDVGQKVIILLGLLGIVLAANLIYIHWKLVYDPNYLSPCQAGESISCDAVNSSEYSEIFGIPVSVLGMGFYIVVIALAWLSTTENQKAYGSLSPLLLLGAGIGGIAFTLYLTSIEEFVLGIWCPLCVVSAFLSTFIFVAATKIVGDEPLALLKPAAVPAAQAAPAVQKAVTPIAQPKKAVAKKSAKKKKR